MCLGTQVKRLTDRICEMIQWVHKHAYDFGFLDKLTISAYLDQNSYFANSIDRNEPSHQDLPCLPFCFRVNAETPISGSGQIQSWKTPLQKL